MLSTLSRIITHFPLASSHSQLLTSRKMSGKVRRSGEAEPASAGREGEGAGCTAPRYTSVYSLAYLLQKRKRYVEASELYRRACDGYKQKLGSQHPTVIACLKDFAAIQQKAENKMLLRKGIHTLEETARFVKARIGSIHKQTLFTNTPELSHIHRRLYYSKRPSCDHSGQSEVSLFSLAATMPTSASAYYNLRPQFRHRRPSKHQNSHFPIHLDNSAHNRQFPSYRSNPTNTHSIPHPPAHNARPPPPRHPRRAHPSPRQATQH